MITVMTAALVLAILVSFRTAIVAAVNGPKTWSLAAALHPDIATAYDAAQARAAGQIIGWLGQHAATRVGPRGRQVQVPVEAAEAAEAVTVAHYTSRAGDLHRHLHPQIDARVFAAGKWRGLHTVGVRDSRAVINGIGHAAGACDPHPSKYPPRRGWCSPGTPAISLCTRTAVAATSSSGGGDLGGNGSLKKSVRAG